MIRFGKNQQLTIFFILSNTRGRVSCCSTCMSVFGFFMVVTCFICIGALLYMHLQLKENVEKIREEVNKGDLFVVTWIVLCFVSTGRFSFIEFWWMCLCFILLPFLFITIYDKLIESTFTSCCKQNHHQL